MTKQSEKITQQHHRTMLLRDAIENADDLIGKAICDNKLERKHFTTDIVDCVKEIYNQTNKAIKLLNNEMDKLK